MANSLPLSAVIDKTEYDTATFSAVFWITFLRGVSCVLRWVELQKRGKKRTWVQVLINLAHYFSILIIDKADLVGDNVHSFFNLPSNL
ncbi:protein of unknown function [Legionella hackeliae]|uniref:Uncharacterized protein n=1 Tax=Legionella hackeliae TaxID=449 RepID=A0A0A8UMS7_LEGHA|nr:protein of unknown function [Legionella hackeliae]